MYIERSVDKKREEILEKELRRLKAYRCSEIRSTKWLKFSQRLYPVIMSNNIEYYSNIQVYQNILEYIQFCRWEIRPI